MTPEKKFLWHTFLYGLKNAQEGLALFFSHFCLYGRNLVSTAHHEDHDEIGPDVVVLVEAPGVVLAKAVAQAVVQGAGVSHGGLVHQEGVGALHETEGLEGGQGHLGLAVEVAVDGGAEVLVARGDDGTEDQQGGGQAGEGFRTKRLQD